MMGENGITASARIIFAVLLLLFPTLVPTADCDEGVGSVLAGEFAETVFEQYSLQEAVRMLVEKAVPVEQIIGMAQKAGYGDGEITVALYLSGLTPEEAIIGALGSDMDAGKVMVALRNQGVDPVEVIGMPAVQQLDMDRLVSIYKYMLDSGFTESGLMVALFRSGTDYNTIGIAAERLGISPATIVAAYRTVFGGQGTFGHLYTKESLPQPALISVGVARINKSGRNDISPSIP